MGQFSLYVHKGDPKPHLSLLIFNHVPSKLLYLYFHRPEVKAGENYHIFFISD